MGSQSVSQESLNALRQEVASLEEGITIAIDDLEKEFYKFEEDVAISIDDAWTPSLNTIDLYSLAPLPPLAESIRQIFIEDEPSSSI